MDRNVALVVAVSIGAAVAAQAPLNSRLAYHVGGLPATTIALGVSFVALIVLTTATGKLGGLAHVGDAPGWAVVCGGVGGALYVGLVWGGGGGVRGGRPA